MRERERERGREREEEEDRIEENGVRGLLEADELSSQLLQNHGAEVGEEAGHPQATQATVPAVNRPVVHTGLHLHEARPCRPTALRDLYASCRLSCPLFPHAGPDWPARGDDVVGLDKLRVELAHSSVVVSVFCRDEDLSSDAGRSAMVGIGGLVNRVLPRVDPSDGRLVGFGRAALDLGLTASIYDVMGS